jgi:O-antigen/teichoic acid export membrane protein
MSKFLKGSILYFLGNSLSKVVAFFLLPIYSKFISPEDFGYFDLWQSYLYLLIPLITFESYLGVLRFLKENDFNNNINKLITTGFSTLVLFIILLIVIILFHDLFQNIRKITLISILFTVLVIQKYYSSICRGLNYNKLFVFSGIFSSFLVAICNYIMIIYYGMKLDSLFWSAIIGFLYQIIHMEIKLKLRNHIQISLFDFKLLKKLILFSLPISVGSILFYFLNSYNRLIIETKIGLEANGFYAIASKFSLMITFLTSAFTMAWQDYSFSLNQESENREKLAL